jgi:hypothetical protein
MVKCLWKEKSDSWIHEKWITHLPEGSKSHSKRKKYMLQTMEIWWKLGIQRYRLHKHKKQRSFYESI